jgi:hypothetical protein
MGFLPTETGRLFISAIDCTKGHTLPLFFLVMRGHGYFTSHCVPHATRDKRRGFFELPVLRIRTGLLISMYY